MTAQDSRHVLHPTSQAGSCSVTAIAILTYVPDSFLRESR